MRRLGICVFATAVTVWLLALSPLVAEASTGTATFSAHTPAKGSVSKNVIPPTLRVNATDISAPNLNATTFLTLDGVVKTTTRSNPGSWVWDDELQDDVWVVDYSTVVMSTSLAGLTEGVHVATATVTSAAGTSTDNWSFTYSTPPKVTTCTPSPNAALRVTSTPTLSVTLDDPQTSPVATMTLDGTQVPATYNSGTRTFSYAPPSALADGTHTASLTFQDQSGWGDTYTWTFFTGPIVFSQQTPVPGGYVANTAPIPFSIRVDDIANLTSAQFKLDGLPLATMFSLDGYEEQDEEGYRYWVVTDPTAGTARASATVSEGTHTLSVTVNGATGPNTTSWIFTYGTPPKVLTMQPANNSNTYADTTPLIKAIVDDPTTSADATMTLDGVRVPATWDAATKTFSYEPVAALADGRHDVSLTARDAAGWENTTSWFFYVSTTANVSIPWMTPAAGTTITAATTPISVDVSSELVFRDPPLPGDQTLLLDGQPLVPLVSFPDQGWDDYGDYYFNAAYINVASNASGLADGPHTAVVTVKDYQDRVATRSWSFNVAEPPKFSQLTPATGTTTGTPVISAQLSDNSSGTLDVTMTVDGTTVPASMNQGTRVVSYQPFTPFANGSRHTIKLDAKDSIGATSSATWSFLVQNNTTMAFSAPYPAVNAVVGAQPSITVVASGSVDVLFPSAALFVDGAPIRTAAQIYAAGNNGKATIYSYWCPVLPDGTRTVRAELTDIVGVTGSYTWSFKVNSPPVVSATSPVNQTVSPSLTPTITVNGSDNTPGPISYKLTVDGSQIASQSASQGAFSVRVPAELSEGTTHTAVATVKDGVGNTSTTTWLFAVARGEAMTMDTCTSCHTAYPQPHQAVECGRCHHASTSCEGSYCHGPGNGPHGNSMEVCTTCHGPAVPGGHAGISLEAPHASRNFDQNACGSCHVSALHREHANRTGATTGEPVRCVSCHGDATQVPASMATSVTAAIATGDTACTACHAGARTGHHDIPQHNPVDSLAPSCSRCHRTNLIDEHAAYNIGCVKCHDLLRTGGSGFASLQSAFTPVLGEETTIPPAAPGTESPHDAAAPEGAGIQTLGLTSGPSTGCSYPGCHDPSPHGPREDCETCHFDGPTTIDPSTVDSSPVGWDPSGPNADVPTPHKGYATTTSKCAVCHQVHEAPSGGELLLRTGAAESCVYCHVATATSSSTVYAGDPDNYYKPSDYAHNRTSQSACNNCHSVHGDNTMDGAVSTEILRDWSKTTGRSRSGYSEALLATWPDPANMTDRNAQVTAFCTGCHSYFTQSYEGTLTAYGFDHKTDYTTKPLVAMRSHLMTAAADGFDDATGSVDGKVAWAGSMYCSSCHDAGSSVDTSPTPGTSFPHYTPGAWKFMQVAESQDGTRSGSPADGTDGLCLKCHRKASSGVGTSF